MKFYTKAQALSFLTVKRFEVDEDTMKIWPPKDRRPDDVSVLESDAIDHLCSEHGYGYEV